MKNPSLDAGFGISMLASFIYIVLMRWLAGILVWLTTYAVLTLLGYGMYSPSVTWEKYFFEFLL